MIVTTYIRPVQDEAIPNLSMERGGGHKIQTLAEDLLTSLRMLPLQRGSMGILKQPRLFARL